MDWVKRPALWWPLPSADFQPGNRGFLGRGCPQQGLLWLADSAMSCSTGSWDSAGWRTRTSPVAAASPRTASGTRDTSGRGLSGSFPTPCTSRPGTLWWSPHCEKNGKERTKKFNESLVKIIKFDIKVHVKCLQMWFGATSIKFDWLMASVNPSMNQ